VAGRPTEALGRLGDIEAVQPQQVLADDAPPARPSATAGVTHELMASAADLDTA
jgi:hypothetical protein